MARNPTKSPSRPDPAAATRADARTRGRSRRGAANAKNAAPATYDATVAALCSISISPSASASASAPRSLRTIALSPVRRVEGPARCSIFKNPSLSAPAWIPTPRLVRAPFLPLRRCCAAGSVYCASSKRLRPSMDAGRARMALCPPCDPWRLPGELVIKTTIPFRDAPPGAVLRAAAAPPVLNMGAGGNAKPHATVMRDAVRAR
mmetsp:Transcript_51896/g.129121  ORF Transcript_51896/g.129121 Transcript_51896/m.129121 type:complete len:205 (-) Transcript_51896:31-645(-)